MWQHDEPERLMVTQRDNNGAAIRREIAGSGSDLIQGEWAADRFQVQLSTYDCQDLGEVDADYGIERTRGGCDRDDPG
ncbi:MAG: hypothetical protein DHS20C16_21530 [Phycisphaerae bacterium]|nr:MAG: hypothetical protein DHS20C16_21530 [Phycisphaerae bacterium]